MKGLKITLILLLFTSYSYAQFFERSGYKIGLSYTLGSPVHRLGLQSGLYCTNDQIQLQGLGTIFYCFKNYGPKIPRWEAQLSLGMQLAFGPSLIQNRHTANLSEVSNFTNRKYTVGYSLKYYLDEIGTKQSTGLIGLRAGRFFMVSENDGLVFKHWDRYRTGAFAIGYDINRSTTFNYLSKHRVALNLLLYTASAQDKKARKVRESDYPSRFGYLDLDSTQYAETSHGILSLSWQSNFSPSQNMFVEIGIDDERIRNFVQNKLIHDMPLLPKRWNKVENPHIPMKTPNGDSYLYQEGQEIRPSKFVWGIGLNRVLFY